MARQLRKKSGTGIYHVMVRGINRQDIFEDEEDYLQMVSILRALSDRHDEQGLRLPPLSIFYAYCMMSNHLHLLLREQEEEVSDVVKRIGVTYAHYFNKNDQKNRPHDLFYAAVVIIRGYHQYRTCITVVECSCS